MINKISKHLHCSNAPLTPVVGHWLVAGSVASLRAPQNGVTDEPSGS